MSKTNTDVARDKIQAVEMIRYLGAFPDETLDFKDLLNGNVMQQC